MSATIRADTAFIADYFAQLEARLDDMTPLMESIGQEFETLVSSRFETFTDPSGASWAPWAESTKANYPDDANGRLLDRYGDMLRSLARQATSRSVTVGFGQPHAAYHEFRTKHMPRRGLLFDDPEVGTLGQADQESILDIVGQYLS